jgi:hypothetical protein
VETREVDGTKGLNGARHQAIGTSNLESKGADVLR